MNASNVVPFSTPRAFKPGADSKPSAASALHVRFGEFELDEANARLLNHGTAVALAPKAFSVLCALARRPGALATKHKLLDDVWGHQFVSDSVLKTTISDLRTALGDAARQPRFIETVSRRGYRFIAAIDPIGARPADLTERADRSAHWESVSETISAGKPCASEDSARQQMLLSLPRSAFATIEEFCTANELLLQLRELLLRSAPAAISKATPA